MKIAVFGATGATGCLFTEAALQKDIEVYALVRPASRMPFASKKLHTMQGSLLNPADVKKTVQHCQAVFCLFGPRPPWDDIFCAEATRVILQEMKAQKINRLICQTGAMIGEYPENRSIAFRILTAAARKQMPEIMKDRSRQEELIQKSALKWTIIKPPRLTNKPPKKIIAGANVKMKLNSHLSRHSLAGFLVQELLLARFVNQTVFIKN